MPEFSTLRELAQERAKQQADHVLYTFVTDKDEEHRVMTYTALDRQARAIGALLQQHHACGERVLLLYPPGLEFIAAFFGCLYAGAVAVPAYPPRNKRHLPRIQTILHDARAQYICTLKKTRTKIQQWLKDADALAEVTLLTTDALPADAESFWSPPQISGGNLAFLQYTSGSTSAPKGVMVSHANLLHNLSLIETAFGVNSESIGVTWLPPYHDMGLIGSLLSPLFVGFPVYVMAPETFLRRPLFWLETISTYRATTSGGPNFAYDVCVTKIPPEQRETLDLSSWRVAFNGAEPVQTGTLQRFTEAYRPYGFRREAWFPCYGLAEATLFVASADISAPPTVQALDAAALEAHQVIETRADDPNARSLVGSGHVPDDQQIMIVNPDTCLPCPPGQIGEVWVTGDSVTQGYWNKPDLSRDIFQAFTAGNAKGPFLRTGDMGFLRGRELFITGRRKDLLIIHGRNHYPQDIEQTVEHSYPALRWHSSAAFSVESDEEERLVIVAEVERRFRERRIQEPQEFGRQNRHHLAERRTSSSETEHDPQVPYRLNAETALATIQEAVVERHEVVPHSIVLIRYGTIPRTSSGKIQRFQCRRDFLNGELYVVAEKHLDTSEASSEHVTEEDSQHLLSLWETFVAQLWGDTLNLNWGTLAPYSNFFETGGDSLHAITLTGKLSDAIGVELETDLLYQYPHLHELSEFLEEEYGVVPSLKTRDSLLAQYREFCHPERPDFPLLPLQQSFFIGQAAGDIAIYMFLDLTLEGHLHPARFQEAIRLVTQRHPAMRTRFFTTGDGPRQQELSSGDFEHPVRYQDLRGLNQQQQDESIRREIDDLAAFSFAPNTGKHAQAVLLTLDEHRHRFLINFHHLTLDGFSVRIWFEELHTLYAALSKGEHREPVPQTTLSFKEYVEIYTARQQTAQRERDRKYWLRNFPSYEPFPALPDAGGDSSDAGFDAFIHRLPPDLIERLRTEARSGNVTLFSLLFAAFFKLFALWTTTNRLLINTPHLNRQPYAHDIQEVIGCFTDILPVLIEHALDTPLRELIHDVHRALADMHRHNSLSGVEIARLIAEQQHTTPQAVSPVIFSSALFPLNNVDSADTYRITSADVRTGAPSTWLDVIVYEAFGEFVCSWNFLRTQFSEERIAALARQYEHILQDFADQPHEADPLKTLLSFPDFAAWYREQQKPPQQVRALSDEERQRIVVDWNDTAADYPLETCLHHLIEAQAEETPEADALVYEGHSMSYRELNQRANRLAHYLKELGVGPDILVGISMERSFEMVIGLLGIMKAGGAYIPIDPEYPQERVAFMLSDANPPVLLTQQRLVPQLPAHQPRMVCLDSDWEQIAAYPSNPPDVQVAADNLIYVIYTSGSTGKPKGAMNLHRALVNRLLWMQDAYPLTPDDRVLQKTPFSFDVSGWEFWWPLMTGATLVIAKPGGHRDSAYLTRLIQEQQISTMHFVPSMLQVFLEEPDVTACTSLKRVICSGEALPYRIQERFFQRLNAELHNLYGPTEAAIDVSSWQCRPDTDMNIVPIGRPIANTQLYILSSDLQQVPVGVEGELHIGGVNLARGYLNRPELTREKFIPNPFASSIPTPDPSQEGKPTPGPSQEGIPTPGPSQEGKPTPGPSQEGKAHDKKAQFPSWEGGGVGQISSRLYKTGDLCRFLPDGNIEYLGRLDHQVKIRGFRIELGEIEAVLAEHEGVHDAAVLAREEQGDTQLAAYLIPAESTAPQTHELRKFLQQKLPDYMIPAAFVVLDAFPLTPNGKIDRRAFPAPDRASLQTEYTAPRTPVEEMVSTMWANLLNLEKVGIHENFFEIGGHSLLAAQLIARIQETFQVELPINRLFANPSIAHLAATIEELKAQGTDTDIPELKRSSRRKRRMTR